MTQEAIERRGAVTRPTLTVDSTDLLLGDKLALLVDRLRLGPKVDVSLRRRPTADDKTAGHLLVIGTSEQINVFKRAFNVYQESVEAGMSERALKSEMDTFFSLQQLRYGQRST